MNPNRKTGRKRENRIDVRVETDMWVGCVFYKRRSTSLERRRKTWTQSTSAQDRCTWLRCRGPPTHWGWNWLTTCETAGSAVSVPLRRNHERRRQQWNPATDEHTIMLNIMIDLVLWDAMALSTQIGCIVPYKMAEEDYMQTARNYKR